MSESSPWLPEPDELSRPFFEGARVGELRLQSCNACAGWMYPLKKRCQHCGSTDLTWRVVSGRGTLYSHALLQRVYHPRHERKLPLMLAWIDLEEGVRMPSNLVGCDPADARVGMVVQVTFERFADGAAIPVFSPAERQE